MSYTIIIGFFGLVTTVLWLVIGWRAMKAHEALSESVGLLQRDVGRLRADLSEDEKRKSGAPKLND